jgi:transposase-like protein
VCLLCVTVFVCYRAKPRISTGAGRRTYTEEELQAALRDIQSGKLGTRRAAVIYGIPRSTLRNKVYKLERERERDHLLLQPTLPVVVPPSATTTTCPTEETSGDEEHRTLSMEELVRCSGLGLENLPATDSLRQLLQSRTEKPTPTPSYPHIETGLAPYISQLLGNEAPNITELMKRMATSSNGTNGTENRGSGDENSDENVILRIPSFKPNGTESSEAPESVGSGSNSPVPNKNIGVSLRDVITKSITQKFQQNPTPSISVVDPATLMANPLKRLAPPTPPAGLSHSSNSQHKQAQDDKNKQKSGKGTRPKRGKYRNYDRDSLIEAVRAVQRGEMSVHRAGSYYGVPHSTLEYKVKERHLMRPRKRDMNKATEEKSPKLHTSAPMPTRTPPKAPTFPTPQIPNLAAMASLANGLKVPSGLYPPYQFWPNANPYMLSPELYQEQLLASHMMQRAAGKSDAPNMTDRFFDGLIRSTLDRQPNAAEGISNRALLEQLCRGRQQQTVVDLSQEEEKEKKEIIMSEQVTENSSLGEVCDTETAKEKQDSTTEEGTSEEQKID